MQIQMPDYFDWREIDELIFAGKTITAMKTYRVARRIGLRSAYEAINGRVEILFATSRDRFGAKSRDEKNPIGVITDDPPSCGWTAIGNSRR